MNTNIRIEKQCEYCKSNFIAKTLVTRYCSHKCNQRYYKILKREEKINKALNKIADKKIQLIQELESKSFLTVKEVAQLLNCSNRSVYRYIDEGLIKATNLGQRLIRIKRTELDNIFES
ncbi:helix-turn-helix domain-containing protein [Chryseobacterium sp.]|uniref:helix-turn-helix domain-containing protein n=1 Tax=Chryseobacterium sp. TaxID=1871047 RepID=UPI00388F8996